MAWELETHTGKGGASSGTESRAAMGSIRLLGFLSSLFHRDLLTWGFSSLFETPSLIIKPARNAHDPLIMKKQGPKLLVASHRVKELLHFNTSHLQH